MKTNEVIKKEGYYISVAFKTTYDADELIDETALVFTEDGKKRFWILKYDVRGIYDGLNLEQAKLKYKEEAEKGNESFWTDATDEELGLLK